jgi:hypothetical protein
MWQSHPILNFFFNYYFLAMIDLRVGWNYYVNIVDNYKIKMLFLALAYPYIKNFHSIILVTKFCYKYFFSILLGGEKYALPPLK